MILETGILQNIKYINRRLRRSQQLVSNVNDGNLYYVYRFYVLLFNSIYKLMFVISILNTSRIRNNIQLVYIFNNGECKDPKPTVS